MRIFNGTKAGLDIPLSGIQRLQVGPKSISGDFLPSTEFLSLLVSSYDYSEVALVVSGPYEINMCSSVSGAAGFVVQSLEEAIERFNPKEPEVEPTKITIVEEAAKPTPEEIKEEVKEEQDETMMTEPTEVEEVAEVEVPVEESVEEEVEEKPETTQAPSNAPRKNKNKKKKH